MSAESICCQPEVLDVIGKALEEDISTGDATTLSLVPESSVVEADIIARGDFVIAGSTVAAAVFETVDSSVDCTHCIPDGNHAGNDEVILSLHGRARSILTAERTALNFMQRMTGIATMTNRFVKRVAEKNVIILDTRKTTPTLRMLEKYAVKCGGGQNHRMGLYDRVMIKDNHRRFWQDGEFSLCAAVEKARKEFPDLMIEVEVETVDQLEDAITAKPEWLLLDNMSPQMMKECVSVCHGRARLEASGGITLENIDQVADAGIDAVSLGCLTHSAPAADLSLEIR